MKTQDVKNFQRASFDELQKELVEKEKALVAVRMEMQQGTVKNVHSAQSIRRDIAQLRTIMHMKELTVDTTTASQSQEKPEVKKPAVKKTASTSKKAVVKEAK